MADPKLPNHKGNSNCEDRFARKNDNSYSGGSSAAVVTITVIVVGIVFYVTMHS